jgi:hypothetical protein
MLGVFELERVELLRDLCVWAYERSTQQYIKVKKSLQEPDPTRLTYREQIYEIVGDVVRRLEIHARDDVTTYAEQHVDDQDRDRFIALVLDDLRRLHEGVIARYRLKPSEYAAWRAAIRSQLKP